jgi:hypothetical protein
MWGADDPTPPVSSYTSPAGRGERLLLTNVGIELRRATGMTPREFASSHG